MAIKILKTTFVAHRVFLLARGKGGGLGLQPHTQLGALAPCWPCGRRQGWSSCPCARVTRGRASADGTGSSPGVSAPGVCRGRSVGLGRRPTEGSCLVGPHYHSERRLSGVPSSQVISWASQRIVTLRVNHAGPRCICGRGGGEGFQINKGSVEEGMVLTALVLSRDASRGTRRAPPSKLMVAA